MYSLNLQGVDLKKLFQHLIGTSMYIVNSHKFTIKSFFSLLRNILMCTREIRIINKSDTSMILFLQLMKVKRQDIRQILVDVSSLLNQSQYDFFEWKSKLSFSLIRVFEMINLCFSFWNDICKESEFWMIRWSMLSHLISVADMEKQLLNSTFFNKYNLCVVIYDANFYDNFFSQKFKLAGIKTVTLQHGVMLAARKGLGNSLDFMGLEFNGIVSDYFLVWNDFTKNEAVKQGISEEKIKVLGNVKCLNVKKIRKCNMRVFGLILDGKCEDENNIPMIKLCNEIAEKYNYKFIVRYHPAYIGNEFHNDIDVCFGKECPKGISLYDYLSEVSFCILSNSTVLFELPYYQIPYYRYSSQNLKDKYCNLNEPSFHTFNEFSLIFEKTDNIKNYYPSSDKIKNKYKLFLESFCTYSN